MAIKITTLSRPVRSKIEYWHQMSLFGELIIARAQGQVCYLGFCSPRADPLSDLRFRFPVAELCLIEHKQDLRSIKSVVVSGTEFQVRVWEELTRIARGERISYGELAARVGMPTATRAVASAVGANPVSLIIPCHRVVRTDGSLGGYYWGMDLKQRILLSEVARATR